MKGREKMGDKTVYNVKVYFSKGEYIEWDGVTDLDWDEVTLDFTNDDGDYVSVVAKTHVIVVTEKQVHSSYR